MTMANEQIQALKAAAEMAAGNDEYGVARRALEHIAKPDLILSLLAEREADKALIAEQAKRIPQLEEENSFANEKVDELARLVRHNLSRAEDAERIAERLSKSSSLLHPGLLHATNELVVLFSHALADKLYAAQEKYNHGTSWRNDDWQEACQRDFQTHVSKGDPRDVAAYCAFMWWHGWSTKPLEARTLTVNFPARHNNAGFVTDGIRNNTIVECQAALIEACAAGITLVVGGE